MNSLPADKIPARNAWLHDIFIWTGVTPATKAARTDYNCMYKDHYDSTRYKNDAEVVKEAIIYRKFSYIELTNLEGALKNLHFVAYVPFLHTELKDNRECLRPKVKDLACYIASFCQEKKLYWDDSTTTQYEFDQIKNTIVGQTLIRYNCLLSQQVAKQAKTATPKSTTQTQAQATPKQPGQPPASDYKSSGPHSQDIPNLIGQPNNKVTLNSDVYCVIADKVGKNTPKAFITPLKYRNNTLIKLSRADAEKVKFSSGNDYTDCACWFETSTEADDFCYKCLNKYGSSFTNIHVVASKADPNGYFEVSTEFGSCFIKAKSLNEMLEALNTQNMARKRSDTVANITLDNVDLYEAALYHEM